MPLTLNRRSSAQFELSFSQFWHSSNELSDYVDIHFYDHLCAATTVFLYAQNISDDHPAVEILHDLETAAYSSYYVGKNLSGDILARRIIQAIFKWTNMLKCRLKVGARDVLWFSFFWPNFLGCGCLYIQRWFDGTSVSIDKQDLSGNVMHNKSWKTWKDVYGWTRWSSQRLLSAAQDSPGKSQLIFLALE